MKYDNIHNIEQKTQVHNIEGGNKVQAQRGTSYDWSYDYDGNQPHAPTHIGNRSFSYDANGNQTGWTHDSKGTRRNIIWDDENRVMEIQDPSHTLRFKYDAGGQRIIKEGQQGRTVYVNQYYVVKNGATVSKHIFAGTTRLATALIHGQKPTRVSGSGDTTSSYGGSDTNTTTSQKGKGKQDKPVRGNGKASGPQTTAASDNADTHAGKSGKSHPGKGMENRSERANEVAQNTVKNPNLNGQGHPGQGISKRSERAKERSSNLEKNPHAQANETPEDPWVSDTGSLKLSKFMYFYHPDHLGSTSYVTDGNGELYEHVAYFPFGESWVTEARNGNNIDYLFTSKEMDPETGLYYYGARYYDPRTSVWQSVDPILDDYIDGKPNSGVYNSKNMSLFIYSYHNPVLLRDPDGNSPVSYMVKLVAKKGVAKGLREYGNNIISKRLGKYMTDGQMKKFRKEMNDVLGDALEDEWWEVAIELTPGVGDIYGTASLAKKAKKAYDKLQDLENKMVGEIAKTLKGKEKARFLKNMRRNGVADARKDAKARNEYAGKDEKFEGMDGHHRNNVADHNDRASDPRNVEFMNRDDHFDAHQNDWTTKTTGPNIDRI